MSESNADGGEVNKRDIQQIASGNYDVKNPGSNETMRKALDILSGKEPKGEDDADNSGADGGAADDGDKGSRGASKGKPKTIIEAAERLGIKPEDFYKLEVSIEEDGEAQPFTLSALKDAHKERQNFQLEQLEWGENKATQEGELLRSRNEIVELLSMLPKEAIKPEVINKIRQKHDASIKLENERTLNVIPEWKNEQRRTDEMGAMREHLTKAGFPTNYLNNVSDHRTMRYIRENMLREQRITKALSMIKLKTPKGQAPTPRGNSMRGAPKPTTAQRGNAAEGQKISAITNLLTQGN